MTENLTQDLIDLGHRRLGSDEAAEFRFDHREHRLDLASLMVMVKEGRAVEVVVVPHPAPKAVKFVVALGRGGVNLEGDISCPTYGIHSVKVTLAGALHQKSD